MLTYNKMPFGLRKMFFGTKNKGPLESRTVAYVHKNSPVVNTAKQIGLTTQFDFQSKPWTVTYTGTPTQWNQLLQFYPDALQRNPMNITRKVNNLSTSRSTRRSTLRSTRRKTRSKRRC